MADEIKFTDSTTDLTEGESSNATLGEKAWYVVNTYSTHENKVKENLKRRVESMGLQDLIFRIIVAEQEVPVMKDGMPTEKKAIDKLGLDADEIINMKMEQNEKKYPVEKAKGSAAKYDQL